MPTASAALEIAPHGSLPVRMRGDVFLNQTNALRWHHREATSAIYTNTEIVLRCAYVAFGPTEELSSGQRSGSTSCFCAFTLDERRCDWQAVEPVPCRPARLHVASAMVLVPGRQGCVDVGNLCHGRLLLVKESTQEACNMGQI